MEIIVPRHWRKHDGLVSWVDLLKRGTCISPRVVNRLIRGWLSRHVYSAIWRSACIFTSVEICVAALECFSVLHFWQAGHLFSRLLFPVSSSLEDWNNGRQYWVCLQTLFPSTNRTFDMQVACSYNSVVRFETGPGFYLVGLYLEERFREEYSRGDDHSADLRRRLLRILPTVILSKKIGFAIRMEI